MSNWKAYNDLAWTVDWFVGPSDYEDEVSHYISLIHKYAANHSTTLLHLGSGAGEMDWVFKRHFTITGVDISSGMIAKARSTHPDIEYIEGDIRSLHLKRKFDAVVIPDCIDYMVTLEDLNKAIKMAVYHLKLSGILLVVGKTLETFQNNNFAYTGEKDGIHITLLENNYLNPSTRNSYEATLIYLIRQQESQQEKFTVHMDRHVLGLFSQKDWEKVFRDNGLVLHRSTLDDVYDKYLLGEGKYPMQVFIGVKI
jgi:ubiquinone/menaquinone biosynthesis C-methylase UbiE